MHLHTKIKRKEKENDRFTFQNEEKNNLECFADKDFYLWFNSCPFDLVMTGVTTLVHWIDFAFYRSIEYSWYIWMKTKKKKIRSRAKRSIILNHSHVVCMSVCVSTFRPVSYKYRNFVGMFAVTSIVHKYDTKTIWQLHSKMCVLSSETHAKKLNELNKQTEYALMQPIFGYCILIMRWIVHKFLPISTKKQKLSMTHTLTMHFL